MSGVFNDSLRNELLVAIRKYSSPLEAQPTGVEPQLSRLEGIRAVLFDVYGTLLISGSGDVGTTNVDARPAAFGEALAAVGIQFHGESTDGVRLLAETIAAHHARSREAGIAFPEVDIREIWRDVLDRLPRDPGLTGKHAIGETTRLALEYEVRTNPVWPMPGVLDALQALATGGLQLGIVSNAQCFTPLLIPVLLRRSLDELGFDEELSVWSYEHRQAKPGAFLYECVRDTLDKRNIAAGEVLYVGNDQRKDVVPASRAGFRTALFAGDARSYRPGTEEERAAVPPPDLVLTKLAQLPGCVLTARSEGF